MKEDKIMMYAQIDYRSLATTRYGFSIRYETITKADYTIDRYNIYLD